MEHQRNQTETVIPNRLTVEINGNEIKRWRNVFSEYGTKTLFEKSTGVPRQTLLRVLKTKKGDHRIIEQIRGYVSCAA